MKSSAALLPVIVLLSFATNAFAWGPDGHKIVCRIAYELLDSDAQRAEVDRLVGLGVDWIETDDPEHVLGMVG